MPEWVRRARTTMTDGSTGDGRRPLVAGLVSAALTSAWLGGVAGAVEGPVRALSDGYYFHAASSYASFVLVPALAHVFVFFVFGLVVAAAVSLAVPGRRIVPVTAGLVSSAIVFLYWGAVFDEPFLSTPGNIAGHVGMVVAAFAVFALAGHLLRAAATSSRRRALTIAVTSVLTCALLAVGTLGVWVVRSNSGAWGASPVGDAATPVRPMNLLLVTIDTLRADRLGCYGYSPDHDPREDGLGTSPVIDALARRGTVFTSAIVPQVTTDPSHSSIMTSLYPRVHGVTRNGMRLPSRFITLAEVLRGAGYATAAAVSVEHLDGYMSGLSQGFETYADRGYLDRFRRRVLCQGLPDSWKTGSLGHTRSADETCRFARGWLERDLSEPFFLWVHIFEPHMPFESHEEPGVVFTYDDATLVRQSGGSGPPLASRLYDSEVRRADEAVGWLLEALDEAGVGERTVVAVTADHGTHMCEPRLDRRHWYGHGEVYEETCRVPLVLFVPGRVWVDRVTGLASSMDLGPTLLELLGVGDPREALSGASAVPLLEGRSRAENPLAVMASPHSAAETLALRAARWKLVSRPGEGMELYDLEADPGETVNLVHQCSAVADSLDDLLAGLLRSWGPVGEQAAVTPEVREMLRALGYLH